MSLWLKITHSGKDYHSVIDVGDSRTETYYMYMYDLHIIYVMLRFSTDIA